jgi:hypothetical protein
MLRLIVLAALSMAVFVGAAAAAEAKVFRGKTNQGRPASVVIGTDGLLRAARVNGRARGERWRGTFRAKVLVTRRGHYVDTCRTGRLRFTVRPV